MSFKIQNSFLRFLVILVMIALAATLLQGGGCHAGDSGGDGGADGGADGSADGGGPGTKTVVQDGLNPLSSYQVFENGYATKLVSTDENGEATFTIFLDTTDTLLKEND